MFPVKGHFRRIRLAEMRFVGDKRRPRRRQAGQSVFHSQFTVVVRGNILTLLHLLPMT